MCLRPFGMTGSGSLIMNTDGGERHLPRLAVLVALAVVDADRDSLDYRPDADCFGVSDAVYSDGLRLERNWLPAVARQQLVGGGLGILGRREGLLNRLGFVLLLAADHPSARDVIRPSPSSHKAVSMSFVNSPPPPASFAVSSPSASRGSTTRVKLKGLPDCTCCLTNPGSL